MKSLDRLCFAALLGYSIWQIGLSVSTTETTGQRIEAEARVLNIVQGARAEVPTPMPRYRLKPEWKEIPIRGKTISHTVRWFNIIS